MKPKAIILTRTIAALRRLVCSIRRRRQQVQPQVVERWVLWGWGTMKAKDLHYLRLALEIATQSKCLKAQYGAVIVDKNGRIVGTGYNGKPAGSCNDGVCYRLNEGVADCDKAPCCIHAETNALMYCDRAKTEGGTLYVNGFPCRMCALNIMQAGIVRLVYLDLGADFVKAHGYSDDEFWNKYGCNIEREGITEAQMQPQLALTG